MRSFAATTKPRHLLLCALACLPLVACVAQETPLGTTQWHVTRITSDATRPSLIPENQQGRAFMVFGDRDFTGASGCISFKGKLDWLENDQVLRFTEVASNQREGSKCMPEDEDNANRIKQIISDQELAMSRPTDSTLRLEQRGNTQEAWKTKPALEFISGVDS